MRTVVSDLLLGFAGIGLLVGGFGARTALMISGLGGVILGAGGFAWLGLTRNVVLVPEAEGLVRVPESAQAATPESAQAATPDRSQPT